MGEGVDAELGEGELRLLEFDVAEEELRARGVGGVAVGDEGGGDDGELVVELAEAELGLVVELGGVEEEEDGVGARVGDGGEEAGEGLVVETDDSRFGSGLEGEELRHALLAGVGGGGGEGDGGEDDEKEEEEWELERGSHG